ncbi:MAG TPA: IS4 family transposase, partial [Opitutaceae bacterium]
VEKNPPSDTTAVHWLLLTTIQMVSLKQALKCVRWYCRRWRIEEWHRVLKSGCKIEAHQNHSAQTLLQAITLDAVIA